LLKFPKDTGASLRSQAALLDSSVFIIFTPRPDNARDAVEGGEFHMRVLGATKLNAGTNRLKLRLPKSQGSKEEHL